MNRGIYSVLSGALAHERRMQVFANNMANVNTAGFKQDEQAFKAIFPRYQAGVPTGSRTGGLAQQIMARPSGPSERAFVAPHQLKTTFEPGRIRLTGNPLDVATAGLTGGFEDADNRAGETKRKAVKRRNERIDDGASGAAL